MSRVVITGMGILSTAGQNLIDFWNTLVSGNVTYSVMEDYKRSSNYRISIGARIYDQSWSNVLNEEIVNKYGKASKYAISVAISALKDSGLSISELPKGRTAVTIGTTMGEIQVEEEMTEIRNEGGLESIQDDLFKKYNSKNIGIAVSEAIKTSGPVYVIPTACAAGNYAVTLGKRLIEWGYADLVIAGGVDVFSRVAFTGFQRLLSLTPDLCRPFDRNRKGLVVGEGCGIVILERIDFAKARGAKIHGEIIGSGLTSDRYHMTSPHPDGEGAVRAMKIALDEAQLTSKDIDYISAHGTGTVANEKVEVKSLNKIFGKDSIPPVSSIKSMIGHSMGAASALELISSLQMMENGMILPTVNYSEPDPECPVDCVPNIARRANLNYILSNSFAFGGQVGSLIVRKGDYHG